MTDGSRDLEMSGMKSVSEVRIAANRRNAQRSTGPRTAAGKARSSQIARKHGLAVPANRDPLTSGKFHQLSKELAAENSRLTAVVIFALAEAHLQTQRVESVKAEMLAQATERIARVRRGLPDELIGALAFAESADRLLAIERYSRRARSRQRKCAIGRLHDPSSNAQGSN